jgi:hypothetical protein
MSLVMFLICSLRAGSSVLCQRLLVAFFMFISCLISGVMCWVFVSIVCVLVCFFYCFLYYLSECVDGVFEFFSVKNVSIYC